MHSRLLRALHAAKEKEARKERKGMGPLFFLFCVRVFMIRAIALPWGFQLTAGRFWHWTLALSRLLANLPFFFWERLVIMLCTVRT